MVGTLVRVPEGRAFVPPGEVERLRSQLAGIARWHLLHRVPRDLGGPALSRELKLDESRRADVAAREHAALVARLDLQLAAECAWLRSESPRVVVAHRSEWFARTLAAQLSDLGCDVVARLTNGADAVGVVVAEQPDLLVLEGKLEMLNADAVLGEVRVLAPCCRVAVQVEHDDEVAGALEAGACCCVTKRVHPRDLARELAPLCAASPSAC